MKSLSRLLTEDRIVWLESSDKEECLRAMVDVLVESSPPDMALPGSEEILRAILDREQLLSTGFGLGLAIPHAKLSGVEDFVIGLGVHHRGLDYESLDDEPVHILVMILCPHAHQEEYLRVLSRITYFLKDNRERLLATDDRAEIFGLTRDYWY